MGERDTVLRSFLVLTLVVCLAAIVMAAVCFALSFVQPNIDTRLLYQISRAGLKVGLGAIALSLVVAFGLHLLAPHVATVGRLYSFVLDGRRRWAKIGGALFAVLLISCFIPDFRPVQFSGEGWSSTGWSGQQVISESTAKQYLWGATRLWSVFLLAASVNIMGLALATRDVSRATGACPRNPI